MRLNLRLNILPNKNGIYLHHTLDKNSTGITSEKILPQCGLAEFLAHNTLVNSLISFEVEQIRFTISL